MGIVDLSHPLETGMPVYPGDPGFRHTVIASGGCHLTSMTAGMHCGTHMDAPLHFLQEGTAIDRTDLGICVGPALRLKLLHCAAKGLIEVNDLAVDGARLRSHSRVLLETGWSARWHSKDYFSSHPVLTREAAAFLVDCGVRLLGLDQPSPDREPFEAHHTLLGAGVVLVENLRNLEAITQDEFELIVLPLAIRGAEASPVRAVAVERQG
jgi:kynurenine formamidase